MDRDDGYYDDPNWDAQQRSQDAQGDREATEPPLQPPQVLIAVRPDGGYERVGNGYEAIHAALNGRYFDFAVGNRFGAFVDDEGMLRGLQFNTPASIVLGRALWGIAVICRAEPDDEGETVGLTPTEIDMVEFSCKLWAQIEASARLLGQNLASFANAETLPPPMFISLPDDWTPGDPWPEPKL